MSLSHFLNFFAGSLAIVAALGVLVRQFKKESISAALLFVCIGLWQLAISFGLWKASIQTWNTVTIMMLPLLLSSGPLSRFYIQTLLDEEISKRDLIHSILPITAVGLTLWFLSLPLSKIQWGYHPYLELALITGVLSIFVYVGFLTVTYWDVLSKGKQKSLKFLRIYAILGIVISIVAFAGVILKRTDLIECVAVMMSGFIISFYVLAQRFQDLIIVLKEDIQAQSYENSQLDLVNIESLESKLDTIFHTETLYLDPDITLIDLAGKVGLTKHQLSEYLNVHKGKNFNAYINGFRVELAKKLLIEKPHITTLSIGGEAGFNSHSVFTTAFKRDTGMSPNEWRQQGALPRLTRNQIIAKHCSP